MAIDVGEGLRGIQPVKEVLADEGSHRHPNSQFRDVLQEHMKKQQEDNISGAEVLRRVKHSYDSLYCRTGVQPNAVLMSQDYVSAIETDCEVAVTISIMKAPLSRVFGLTIILTKGEKIVKACIMEE